MADKEKTKKRHEVKAGKRNGLNGKRTVDEGNTRHEFCHDNHDKGKSQDTLIIQSGGTSDKREEPQRDTGDGNAERLRSGKMLKPAEFDSRKLAELTEAFHLFDFDRDGIISFSDLKKVYASLDKEADDEQIKQMIAEGLSPLDFNAFVKLMGFKTLDLDDEEVLLEALSQWDYGTGLISEEKIRHDLMTWGDKFTEEEANAALENAPIVLTNNNEKMINYVQFSNDLCGFRRARNLLKGK